MPEPWDFDAITSDLISAYVRIIKLASGWGTLNGGVPAVYPGLLLPFPGEPYPSAYVYIADYFPDESQGTGLRLDKYTVATRILGGPLSPSYKTNPEVSCYKQMTPVLNELTYRRYLEDPTNNNTPFRYINVSNPQGKVTILPGSRIQAFGYDEQGKFVGLEVRSTVILELRIGRQS